MLHTISLTICLKKNPPPRAPLYLRHTTIRPLLRILQTTPATTLTIPRYKTNRVPQINIRRVEIHHRGAAADGAGAGAAGDDGGVAAAADVGDLDAEVGVVFGD